MRILVTNDDGVASPALPRLAAWASKLGEVTVVAPKIEQSGKSQAIDFKNPIEIKKITLDGGIEAWAVNSTPADCVRFGVTGLKQNYDMVFSGINRGYNLGDDVSYSGTIGAIFEASRLGIKAIAFSTGVDSFDNAVNNLDNAYSYIENNKLLETADLLNVNFPLTEIKGIRITKQGAIFYSDDFIKCGEDMYRQIGEPIDTGSTDLTIDVSAVRNGYISITPVTANKTDFAAYEKLKTL